MAIRPCDEHAKKYAVSVEGFKGQGHDWARSKAYHFPALICIIGIIVSHLCKSVQEVLKCTTTAGILVPKLLSAV